VVATAKLGVVGLRGVGGRGHRCPMGRAEGGGLPSPLKEDEAELGVDQRWWGRTYGTASAGSHATSRTLGRS
jgi:hypothetical protein